MVHFILRRLLTIPIILLLANFFGYAYASYVAPIQRVSNPYSLGVIEIPPVFSNYAQYLSRAAHLDFGLMRTNQPIVVAIAEATKVSIGLLAVSLLASVIAGLFLGLRSVKTDPPRVSSWLTMFASIGLASPSFYIGILFIALSVLYLFHGPTAKPLLPFQGYGWDSHLVLPVLALMFRPTVQIAQVTSGLLAGELEKQYITAARSFGHSLRAIRGRYALRNILAPVILTIAGSSRLLIAELIIIERLFGWPGLGKLLSTVLVLHSRSFNFLYPDLLAAIITTLVAVFLITDLAASILVRLVDPRLKLA